MRSSPNQPFRAQEPLAPDDGPGRELAFLRAELDRLDDALHDLLQQRAEVVARVGASAAKGAVKLRMGRQAAILRRLLARHEGAFPPAAIVRVWLEMLSGTVAMQGPFSVAVSAPGREPGEDGVGPDLLACAREQFGALVALHVRPTAAGALDAVARGDASVAVLPLPREDDGPSQAWWPSLLDQAQLAEPSQAGLGAEPSPTRLHVVARLPIWAGRSDSGCAPALVVAGVPPDPSGDDRSLLGLTLPAGGEPRALLASLDRAGLEAGAALWSQGRNGQVLALVEIAGLLAEDDPRLSALPALARPPVLLGAYALPLQDPRP